MVVLQLISERSRAYDRTSLEIGRVRTEFDDTDVPYKATRTGSWNTASAGMGALVGAKIVGPRDGRFVEGVDQEKFAAHNVSFIVLGTIILWFGWSARSACKLRTGRQSGPDTVVQKVLRQGF